jgi:hypothetical protein
MVDLKENSEQTVKHPLFILMCAGCGRVRSEGPKWHRVHPAPVQDGQVEISHGLCPDCFSEHYPELS